MSKITKKNIILAVLAIIGVLLFVCWGLTSRNFNYNFPNRMKKVMAIIVVSYSIGFSTIIFQTITNNRILTPSIMGLDSLYVFIQTFVIFFFGSRELVMMSDINDFIISVLLMVAMSSILFVFLFDGNKKNIFILMLNGIVIGTLFQGLANFMQVLLDPNEFLILQGKIFASFNGVNNNLLNICILICIFCFLITIKDIKRLDILSMGEDHAINLGINYRYFVRKMFFVVSLLVSVSTVLVGPLIFLGLLIVNLAKEFISSYRHNVLILATFLIGVIAIAYSLFIVERILNYSTTISVIINFLGGLYFIYLILKEKKI